MKFIGYLLVFYLSVGLVNAQDSTPRKPKLGKNDTIPVASAIIDGEYVPWIMTPNTEIRGCKGF